MFSLSMVAMLFASTPSEKLAGRIGAKKCLTVAFLGAGLTTALWSYSRSIEVAILVMTISSAFVTLNYIGYNALISHLTVFESRGVVIGFSSLLLGIFAGIGSFMEPLLWANFFPALPFLLMLL